MSSFPQIFRPNKIVVSNLTVSSGNITTAGVKRPAPDPAIVVRDRPSPPIATPSSANTPRPAAPNGAGQSISNVSPIQRPSRVIYQNRYGQRLDPPVPCDKDYLNVLYTSKTRLCNNHYLKGYCQYGNNCVWDHSEVLTPLQLDTLRNKARTSACRDPFCKDPDCTLGHMCPRGATCDIPRCKFLPEMHQIDLSEVYQFNVDTGQKQKVTVPG